MFGVRPPRRGWLEVAGRCRWWRLPLGGALRPFAQHVAVQVDDLAAVAVDRAGRPDLATLGEGAPERIGNRAVSLVCVTVHQLGWDVHLEHHDRRPLPPAACRCYGMISVQPAAAAGRARGPTTYGPNGCVAGLTC